MKAANTGSAKHVRLERCAAQVGKMQRAALRQVPEADDPNAGRRCRAMLQVAHLRKQRSA